MSDIENDNAVEYEYQWEYWTPMGAKGITKEYFSLDKADSSVLKEGCYFHRPYKPSKRVKDKS